MTAAGRQRYTLGTEDPEGFVGAATREQDRIRT